MSSDEPTTRQASPVPTPSLRTDSALKSHPLFFFEDLYIAIEDSLFKVPRRTFENSSDVFRDMYSVPVPEGKPADGSCAEHPLYLSGVTSEEFAQLLRVLYPSSHGEALSLSSQEWETVLKLANQWQFDTVRATAIRALQPIISNLSPQEAIVKGRQYDVVKWLFDGVLIMARRAEPIREEDVKVIGIHDALKIAHVREEMANILKTRGGWVEWRDRSAVDFGPTILRIFELKVAQPK